MMNESNYQVAEMKVEAGSAAEEQRIQKRRGLIYQMLMSVFANVSILGPAMSLGYSAVVLPTLRSGRSDLTVNKDQASWIASAAAFGTPFGCLLSSLMMRRGRRLCLMVTSTFSLIGWLLIYMSTNYEQLIVGRVVSGVATGLASVPATVYTAEIATPAWRSVMVTWSSIGIALGILLVYMFGYLLQENWRLIGLICGLFPAIAILLLILAVPESPIWLRNKGQIDKARVIMKKFRGVPKSCPVTEDIEKELYCQLTNNHASNNNYVNREKKQSLFENLTKASSLKPFAIMLGYFFFQQFSGIFVVVFYAVDITKEAGIEMDAYLGAILIGLTRLAGSILVACASKKWGRRVPSILSGVGMTVCMGILSTYLFITNSRGSIGDEGVIPALCILLYIFMSTIGFLTLPFAMIGEIFPANVKDVLSGATTCAAYIFSFIAVKTYPDMLSSMGKPGVFLFYAIVSLIGTVFIDIWLPETKGKTLQEIDELFKKKNKQLQIQEECEKMVRENGVNGPDV